MKSYLISKVRKSGFRVEPKEKTIYSTKVTDNKYVKRLMEEHGFQVQLTFV